MTNCAIDEELLLDSRLALFHGRDKWLAIADLHFGYEISQRVKGWLIPFWGMQSIEDRLRTLIHDYQPARLILVGDIVHSNVAYREAEAFVNRLRDLGPDIVLIRGNHDRGLKHLPMLDSFQVGRFQFRHGHDPAPEEPGLISVEGHLHPSWRFWNGAGSRLQAPALIQTPAKLVLPAFSPWAAGVKFKADESHRFWVCAKSRIFNSSEIRPPGPKRDHDD
jgi:putative SbcD/Mre11-related phosphoesterase